MSWITVIYLLLALLKGICMESALSARLPDIYWNITNPIFRLDNTDHIIHVNRNKNNPFEYDQVNIICPMYSTDTSEDQTETYIIHNVSKDEYDQCRISSNASRVVANCSKPHKMTYFTITFRSFTPQPGGLEFHPGRDYYFITTSTGSPNGLERKVGGRCASHHMKMTFKVCCSDDNSVNKQSRNNINRQNEPNRKYPLNSQGSTPSNGDRIMNTLTNVNSGNPIQSLFKKLLPHNNNDQLDNQLNPSGQQLQLDSTSDRPNNINTGSVLNYNRPVSSTVLPPVPVSTPFWWRPHLSKLPSLKHQSLPSNEIGSPSSNHNLNQFTLNSINNNHQQNNKSDVWVVVIGGCVAVVVAFLIVGSLFACTNYLFFPAKRKPGSSCTTLQTQTLHSPAFAQQYSLHTQHHFEYPMQHTIIK